MLDSTLNDETEQDFTDFEPRSQRRSVRNCIQCQCRDSRSEKLEAIRRKMKNSPRSSAEDLVNHDTSKKHEPENCSTEDTLDSGFATSDVIGGRGEPEVANQKSDNSVGVVMESHVLEDIGKCTKRVHYFPYESDITGVPEVDRYDVMNVIGTVEHSSYTTSHDDKTAKTVNGVTSAKEDEVKSIESVCNSIRRGIINDAGRRLGINSAYDRRESSSGDEMCVRSEEDGVENLNAPLPEPSGSLITSANDGRFILNEDLVINCDSDNKTRGARQQQQPQQQQDNKMTAAAAAAAVDDQNRSSTENSPRQWCNRKIEFNLEHVGSVSRAAGGSPQVNSKSQLNSDNTEPSTVTRPISLVIQPCDSIDMEAGDCDCNCHDNSRLQLPRTSAMRHHRDTLLAPKESTGRWKTVVF